jgi:hypothetical protein
MSSRLIRLSVLALAVSCAAVLPAPDAGAAPAHSGAAALPPAVSAAAPIIPGRPSSVSFSSVTLAGQRAAAAVITCALKANNPHHSGHVNGTINTTATATCRGGNNGNVVSIDVTVQLLRSGVRKNTGSNRTTGRNNATANTAIPCAGNSPGSFRGEAGAYIVAPPGYRPTSATLYHTSIELGVTCGLSR